jgi:hypothetical protein
MTEDFSLTITIYRLLFDNSDNGPATFVSADFTPAVTFVGLRGHFHEFTIGGLLAHRRQSGGFGRYIFRPMTAREFYQG